MAETSDSDDEDDNRTFDLDKFRAERGDTWSRTSADWVPVVKLIQIEEGEITAREVLEQACADHGEDPPTDEEIEAFEADRIRGQEERQARFVEMAAKLVGPASEQALKSIGQGFTMPDPAIFKGVTSGINPELLKATIKSQESEQRLLRDAAALQIRPDPTTTAIRDLTDVVVDQGRENRLANEASREIAGAALSEAKAQHKLQNVNIVLTVIIVLVAVAALVVAIITMAKMP
jgi:hypothetical protein